MFGYQLYGNQIVKPVPNTAKFYVNRTAAMTVNDEAAQLGELSALHNQFLVNGQLISQGTGSDTTSVNPVTTIKKPWIDPPDGARSFDEQQSVVLGIVGVTTTVVSLRVPEGYDGVINAISWNYTGGGFVEGSGDLIAKILRSGAAVQNYDSIKVQKGSIQIPRSISPLRIYSNQVIELTVTHAANGILNGNIVGCLQGYFYPSAN